MGKEYDKVRQNFDPEEEVYDDFLSLSDEEHDDSSSSDGSSYSPSPDRSSLITTKGKEKISSVCNKGKENKQPSSAVIEAFKDGGDGKKLTVEQCRTYLRGQGLQSSGTKNVLIERIIAHLNVQGSKWISTCNGDSPDLLNSFGKLELEEKKSIIKLIKDGVDERQITVEMCKVYLRENCLRLSGTKRILIERIKEHLQIQDESGVLKYPEATFTQNCRGDACVGDVVLFKQRVYDTFNVGGRCSSGPPVGIRTVAGRIIKESYGSAKQQHTFTIEVLWSTGERALPPLHPLIIKGRNLYRVKTLRQPWADEESRKIQLQEKHSRGAAARLERRMRVEGNPVHKKLGENVQIADRPGYAASHFTVDNGKTHNKETDIVSKVDPDRVLKEKMMHGSSHRAISDALKMRLNSNPALSKIDLHLDFREKTMHTGNPIISDSSRTRQDNISSFPRIKPRRNCQENVSHMNNPIILDASKLRQDNIPGPVSGITANRFLTKHDYSGAGSVSFVMLRLKSFLAGLIIGKGGKNVKKIMHKSKAELRIEFPPDDPSVGIVRIVGTSEQIDIAVQLINEKVRCRYLSKGCKYGESCQFLHDLLQAQVY